MKKDKITLIVATYNRPKILLLTIKSFLEQVYDNKEMIVINDGSDKLKYHNIKKFCKANKIRYYYKKHSGCASSLNMGIKKAKGKYICFLGDDDLFYDCNALTMRMNYFKQHPTCDVLFTGWADICARGKIIKLNICPEIDKMRIFKSDYLNICTMTIRKEKAKYFNEDYINNEDWEFKIEHLMNLNCQKTDVMTTRQRRWGENKSMKNRLQTSFDGVKIIARMKEKYKEFLNESIGSVSNIQ